MFLNRYLLPFYSCVVKLLQRVVLVEAIPKATANHTPDYFDKIFFAVTHQSNVRHARIYSNWLRTFEIVL